MVQIVHITLPLRALLYEMLLTPDTPRYGLELRKAVGIASGGAYPLLNRLVAAGWLETWWEPLPITEPRPRRRYYRLTTGGEYQARKILAERGLPPAITHGT